jgi:hypothetical protein
MNLGRTSWQQMRVVEESCSPHSKQETERERQETARDKILPVILSQ